MRTLTTRAKRFMENRKFQKQYDKQQQKLRDSIAADHPKLAVIIHLFYTENWSLFLSKLKLLDEQGISFDLFVTTPPTNEPFMEEVAKSFPKMRYMVVPNRGRDILPFVKTVEVLKDAKYEYLLKFHSKKSTHWEGGQDWLTHTMDVLVSSNKTVAQKICRALKNDRTGIIGPSEYYFPLTINFPANGPHMTRMVTRLYGSSKAHEVLQINRKTYGFFGGTMFWARIDAIKSIIEASTIRNFESELGQIDATYAHALERLFCVVPEIDGRTMYELTSNDCKERPYASDNIPDWSTDHDK